MDDFDTFGFGVASADPPAADPRAPAAPSPMPAAAAPQRYVVPSRAPEGFRARAGIGAIAAACGAAVGGVLGGPLGIGAGVAAVGAARNLYRSQGIASADPDQQGESVRCLALGVVGLGIAGYLAYRIYSNDKDDDE